MRKVKGKTSSDIPMVTKIDKINAGIFIRNKLQYKLKAFVNDNNCILIEKVSIHLQ